MADPKQNRVLLGRIGSAHGIRGEVMVQSFAADPADIAAYGPLSDKNGSRTYSLKVVRVTQKVVVARVDGVADRTAAEKLRGVELYVDRERLPETDADEFYHTDLIGLAAVSADGEPLGTIVAVENYGAGDLLEIRLAASKATVLIPFSDPFVPQVDLAAGRAVIVMPDETDDDDDGGDAETEEDQPKSS